jgi:hypothetical protein
MPEPDNPNDSTPVVMLIIEAANGQPTPCALQYVRTFDRFAAGGRGVLTTTRHRQAAKRFKSKEAAFKLWKDSTLRAFTISIEPEDNPSPLAPKEGV